MTTRFRDIIASAMRLLAISAAILLASLLLGQQTAPDPGAFDIGATQGTGQAKRRTRPKAGPAPHLANGLPDFGGNGAWYPGLLGEHRGDKVEGREERRREGRRAVSSLGAGGVQPARDQQSPRTILKRSACRWAFHATCSIRTRSRWCRRRSKSCFCSKATTTCGAPFRCARPGASKGC